MTGVQTCALPIFSAVAQHSSTVFVGPKAMSIVDDICVGGVIKVGGCDVPEGGFGLGVDEIVDVFYGEGGFGGVGDLPDDDGVDVDGVAVEVVDFDGVGFKIADFDADFGGVAEWGDGSESGVADGVDVASEE